MFFIDDFLIGFLPYTLITFPITYSICVFVILPIFLLLLYIFIFSRLSNVYPCQNQSYEMKRCTYKTFYYETSDGIRIACDLYLPELQVSTTISSSTINNNNNNNNNNNEYDNFFSSERKYPVIVAASRYTRSLRIHWIFRYIDFFGGKPFSLVDNQFIKAFLDEGLAVFLYDIRGCGCSEGTQSFLFNDREIQDGHEILEFIKNAPFCNGKLGLWGISYGGITALRLSMNEASSLSKIKNEITNKNKERNIVASANLFHFWNIYNDLAYFGGMRFHWFINNWWNILYILDRQAFWWFGPGGLLLIEGISPVPYERTVRCLREEEENIMVKSESDAAKVESIAISFKEKTYILAKGKGGCCINSGRRARRAVIADHRNNFNPKSVDYTYNDDVEPITKRLVYEESNNYRLEELRSTVDNPLFNDSLPDQLHIGGWFDSSCKSCINSYYQIMGETGSNSHKIHSSLNQYLLLGPWTHGGLQHAFTQSHQSRYKSVHGTATLLPFSFPELLKQFMINSLHSDKVRSKQVVDAPTAVAHNDDELSVYHDEKGIFYSGMATAKEVSRMLTPETPVGYYVMQGDYWRFGKEFPLKSKRISFALCAQGDGASASSTHGSYFSDSMRRAPFRLRSQLQSQHMSLVQTKTDSSPRFLASEVAADTNTHSTYETKVVSCDVNPNYGRGYIGSNRWTTTTDLLNPVNCDMDHPSLSSQLRFTSAPLVSDMEVTGIPTIEFWVSSSNPSADLFVSLQCVQENGVSCYVTEGCLRLMHRYYHNGQKDADSVTPCDHLPLDYLPVRSFNKCDSTQEVSKFQLAWVDMLPVSFLFRKGQRIRVAVYGADIVNFTPVAKESYKLNLRTIKEPMAEQVNHVIGVDNDSNNDGNNDSNVKLPDIPRDVYCSKLFLPVH